MLQQSAVGCQHDCADQLLSAEVHRNFQQNNTRMEIFSMYSLPAMPFAVSFKFCCLWQLDAIQEGQAAITQAQQRSSPSRIADAIAMLKPTSHVESTATATSAASTVPSSPLLPPRAPSTEPAGAVTRGTPLPSPVPRLDFGQLNLNAVSPGPTPACTPAMQGRADHSSSHQVRCT